MNVENTVLLVEDDEHDAFFFTRAVQKNELPFQIRVAQNGLEAIDYLEGRGKFANREEFPFPKFIISDNQMPVMSGNDFLKWLKQDPRFHSIPTVVFGGSDAPADVKNAYENLGVNSYIIKPRHDQLEDVVKRIFQYWTICIVPS